MILGLYHSYPEWSNGATPGIGEPVTGKPPDAKLPLDLSPQGPWSWFVEYLCDRYGGPSRPHIWALEICNEPNLLCWPQLGVADRGRRDGDYGGASGGGAARIPRCCCCPATSDFPDADVVEQGVLVATGWPGFTAAVLDGLRGLDTGGAALPAWSHHNYRDAKAADGRSDRARQVIGLLAEHGWPGDRAPVPDRGRRGHRPARPEPLPELDLPSGR